MDLLSSRGKISCSLLLALATLLITSTSAGHVKKEGQEVKEKDSLRDMTRPYKVECEDQRRTCEKLAELAEGKPLVSRVNFLV